MGSSTITFNPAELLNSLEGDQELMQDLLVAYIEDAPIRMESLKNALDTKDMDGCITAAHSLKGMSGVIRVSELERMALELEAVARTNDVEKTQKLFPKFEAALYSIIKQSKAYLGS